jgi:hypothetical protein
MDARAVAEAAHLGVNTLNVWVARGLVPEMSIGVRGLRRDFDLSTATAIGVMAELTHFGFGAALASLVAKYAVAPGKACCLVTHLIEGEAAAKVGKIGGFTPIAGFTPTYFDSEEELPKALANLRKRSPGGVLPNVYIVVNVKRIEARMQRAEEKWQRSRDSLPKPKAK